MSTRCLSAAGIAKLKTDRVSLEINLGKILQPLASLQKVHLLF